MTARKSKFEGKVVAVPLQDGRFALGVVARHHSHAVVGYFFPETYAQKPSLEGLSLLRAEDAALVFRFANTPLSSGRWHVLGELPGWDRAQWPVPLFRAWWNKDVPRPPELQPYDEVTLVALDRVFTTPEEWELHPEDGYSPQDVAEAKLNRILGGAT